MSHRQISLVGGWALLIAGLVGGLGAVILLAVPPGAPPGVFNYPLSADAFVVVQSVFAVQHLLTGLGFWLFWRAGFAGDGRLAAVGSWSTAVIMTVLGGWEFVAITGSSAPYPSDEVAWIDVGYGTLSLLSGVALVLVGISTARAHALPGGWRWLPLVLGVWVFVPMIPALSAGFAIGRIAIGVWLLLFAVLGSGMLRVTAPAAPVGRATAVSTGASS